MGCIWSFRIKSDDVFLNFSGLAHIVSVFHDACPITDVLNMAQAPYSQDFPRGLGFLYWVYRPVRLLRRHGAGLFRRI